MVGGLGGGGRPHPQAVSSSSPTPAQSQAYPSPGADAAQRQLLRTQPDAADKRHPVSGLQAGLQLSWPLSVQCHPTKCPPGQRQPGKACRGLRSRPSPTAWAPSPLFMLSPDLLGVASSALLSGEQKEEVPQDCPGQALHPDFARRQVEGRSLGLVAARATCVLLGLWYSQGQMLGWCWGGSVLGGGGMKTGGEVWEEGAIEKWSSGEVWKCLMGRESKGDGTGSVVSDQ